MYHIGQVLPLERGRGIEGQIMPQPLWFCFETVPQMDPKAKAWLNHKGVTAWYPTETAFRRVARGPRRKVAYERRVVPGYVLAHFIGQPQWDILFDCRYIRGVVSMNGEPAPISEAAMMEMAQVPQVLAERRRAMLDARTIRIGDTARVTAAMLEGHLVEIESINGKTGEYIARLFGKQITIAAGSLEKVVE